MGRRHLFEINDQPWCPAVLRDGLTDYLDVLTRFVQYDRAAAPILADVMERSGASAVVDLCSGSGGVAANVFQRAQLEGSKALSLTLTDLYPNVASLDRVASRLGPNCTVWETPVDATNVPIELKGVRTMFNATHHFQPEVLKKVLADAFEAKQPLAFFDGASRSALGVAGMICGPAIEVCAVPFMGSPRLARAALSWWVPVLPSMVLWDGVVSSLRAYRPAELQALTHGLEAEDYQWAAGEVGLPWLPMPITYLTGITSPHPS